MVPLSFSFSPNTRMVPFVLDIGINYLGQTQPLLALSGCCHGLLIELDHSEVQFGSVTVGNQVKRKILLSNTGDIGAKFSWATDQIKDVFDIAPRQGYIAPGSEIGLVVTFMPSKVQTEVRFDKVRCDIEGGPALLINLTGFGIGQQFEREVIQFSTQVRQSDVKVVKINNPSVDSWTLRPVFDNDCFAGASSVVVNPNQTVSYEVNFKPMTMTQSSRTAKGEDNKAHTGTLFIPCPDGSALLFNLMGVALPPKPVASINREVPCKIAYTEQLTVTNWMKKSQRFRVTHKLARADLPVSVKGLEYIDVPGQGSVDYKLTFMSHREGLMNIETVFKNEQTQEYLSYDINFKVLPLGVMDTITLKTQVRQSLSYTVLIENPLTVAATCNMTCNYLEGAKGLCSEIHGNPLFRIPAKTEAFEYTFEFFPLRVRQTTARLTLQSHELGPLQFDLVLIAQPAAQLPVERFKATLGDTVVKRLKFLNYCASRTDYAVSINSPDFTSVPTITAPSAMKTGSEVTFEVNFEPSHLGDIRAVLTLSSPLGGDYSWPLFGEAVAPKPSGPYICKSGQRVNIPFKNVFNSVEAFTYVVDAPGFSTKPSETFKAKELKEIVLKYDGGRDEVRSGQLIVSAPDGTSWIYYLRGSP